MQVVCFGLGADCAADRVAFLEELGEDVGADEAARAGDEDERCHSREQGGRRREFYRCC